jgi:hypothetical protein
MGVGGEGASAGWGSGDCEGCGGSGDSESRKSMVVM